MKVFMKSAMLASVGAMAFGLAACDSAPENQAEDQAQTVREASDAAADVMESQAADAPGTAESTMDTQADTVPEAGGANAGATEDQADTTSAPTSN